MECGEEHLVKRSDARYCPSCILIRQLNASLTKFKRPLKCRTCAEPFKPAFLRDRSLCGKCEDERNAPAAERLTWARQCRYCSRPVDPSIPVPLCRSCLKDQTIPEGKEFTRQKRCFTALKNGQNERRKRNHATLAAIAAGQPHIHRLTTEDAHA